MRLSCRRIGKLFFICMVLFTLSMIFSNKIQYHHQTERQSNGVEPKKQSDSTHFNVAQRNLTYVVLARKVDDIVFPKQFTENGSELKLSMHDENAQSKAETRLHSKHPTVLDDIFISVKTSQKFHKERMQVILDTWISIAQKQTYIFTDTDDPEMTKKIDETHIINTKCPPDHHRRSLACKMAQEFDWFINSKKRWFCHFDDDNYVNIDGLVTFLQQYNHTDDWYLGRPSLNHPIEVIDRSHPGQRIAFWFATGGAGVCISRSLALKMVPHAGGGRFMRASEHIRLPDDCTLGYIIGSLLNKELTVIKLFHSHLEPLLAIHFPDIKHQLTFSYGRAAVKNTVKIPGFPIETDPTRFWSIHCHLYPLSKSCKSGAPVT